MFTMVLPCFTHHFLGRSYNVFPSNPMSLEKLENGKSPMNG